MGFGLISVNITFDQVFGSLIRPGRDSRFCKDRTARIVEIYFPPLVPELPSQAGSMPKENIILCDLAIVEKLCAK